MGVPAQIAHSTRTSKSLTFSCEPFTRRGVSPRSPDFCPPVRLSRPLSARRTLVQRPAPAGHSPYRLRPIGDRLPRWGPGTTARARRPFPSRGHEKSRHQNPTPHPSGHGPGHSSPRQPRENPLPTCPQHRRGAARCHLGPSLHIRLIASGVAEQPTCLDATARRPGSRATAFNSTRRRAARRCPDSRGSCAVGTDDAVLGRYRRGAVDRVLGRLLPEGSIRCGLPRTSGSHGDEDGLCRPPGPAIQAGRGDRGVG